MKIIAILMILAIAVSTVYADVCTDPDTPNDSDDDICIPESPVGSSGVERLFLPVVRR